LILKGKIMTEHYNNQASNGAKNPPVQRISDGAVSVKVWRNLNQDGRAVYSTTFQRTYTDPKTGEPRESSSLYKDDLLKLPELASEARRTIRHFQEQDRERAAQDRDRDREPSRHPAEIRHHHEPGMDR
jgi:hypothetical protein